MHWETCGFAVIELSDIRRAGGLWHRRFIWCGQEVSSIRWWGAEAALHNGRQAALRWVMLRVWLARGILKAGAHGSHDSCTRAYMWWMTSGESGVSSCRYIVKAEACGISFCSPKTAVTGWVFEHSPFRTLNFAGRGLGLQRVTLAVAVRMPQSSESAGEAKAASYCRLGSARQRIEERKDGQEAHAFWLILDGQHGVIRSSSSHTFENKCFRQRIAQSIARHPLPTGLAALRSAHSRAYCRSDSKAAR